MRLHARNPRRTTRAEPAQNADAHNVRNPRVLFILLVVVVLLLVVVVVVLLLVVVVAVAVAVVVVVVAVGVAVAVAVAAAPAPAAAAAGGGVVVVVTSYSSPISACQTKPTHAKRLVALLDGGEQSNSESNKATSTRKPLFSKLFALWNDWLLCLTQANGATKSPPVRWDLLDHMLSLLFLLLPPDLNF